MVTYEYKPINLEGPAFRLLRLLKGTGPDIKCELFEAWLSIEDLIPYEAVSYTWGSMELSASVDVDGQTLHITENLYLALNYLRLGGADRILWVDAICIDQGNHQERGHQVQQMGSVYSQADRVVIWLGPATDDTNVLLDSLKRLEQESKRYTCSRWTLTDRRWRNVWSSLQLELMDKNWNLAVRQCTGLESLLERPWFKRVWILQEVANAKRAIVCSGSRSLSARIFALAPSLVNVTPGFHCQAVLDIMPGSSRKESWWNQRRDLQTLLFKFSRSNAGDPRDMVYALLGICSDARDEDFIAVDYTKELQQVIRDTASFLFKLTDCPVDTLSELMEFATRFNNECLLNRVKSENSRSFGEFLRERGDSITITTDVIKAAAENTKCGHKMTRLLLNKRGDEVKITEEVVKAVAANTGCGQQVMQLFLNHQGDDVKITEQVVETAAANTGCRQQAMQLLLNQRGDNVKITEQVVETAAANTGCGPQVMQLLLN